MGQCVSSDGKKRLTSSSSVPNDTFSEIENAKAFQKTPSHKSELMIRDSLKKHSLFSAMNKQDYSTLINDLLFYSVPAHAKVFNQGENGSLFYIVENGKLEVIRSGIKKTILQHGDTFGDMAILTDLPRRATVNTIEPVELWGIRRETFRDIVRNVNMRNFDQNKQFLSGLQIFANLNQRILDSLTHALVQQEFMDSVRVICEGDEGILLFIIKYGQAVVKVHGAEQFRLVEGEMFGEAAVLGRTKLHQFSVYSVGKLTVLSLSLRNIQKIVGEDFEQILERNQAKNSLLANKYIGLLSREKVDRIVESLQMKTLQPDEGSLSNPLENRMVYVLVYGILSCGELFFSHNDVIGFMNKKKTREMLKGELCAQTEVKVGEISIERIEQLLNMRFVEIKKQLKIVNVLKKLEFFSDFSQSKLRFIADATSCTKYEGKEVIFKSSDEAKTFFIIISGGVKIYVHGKVLRVLGRYDIFGDNCLQEKTRSTNAKAISKCKCLEVQGNSFASIMDDRQTVKFPRSKSYLSSFTLNELIFVKFIKKDEMRNCFLAFLKKNMMFFYVEVLHKDSVLTFQIFEKLLHEKNIAISVENLMIMRLVKTFSDSEFIYLVYENFQVVPLVDILGIALKEDQAKFLAASLLVILEYLHEKNVVYREFNPTSLSINREGYPFISSLRSAKIVKDRTKTAIGDFMYSAPELIVGKRYGKAVNFWSLGVMIYEFLYNTLPFYLEDLDNPIDISEKIIRSQLFFPHDSKYIRANELITRLLDTNDETRGGLEEVKYSRWLDSIDWQRISLTTFESPIKVTIQLEKTPKLKESISLTRYLHETFLEHIKSTRPKVQKHRKKLNWAKFF